MVEFFVYSRPAVEAIQPHDVPHIIISIITPDDVEAKLKTNEHTRGILRLAFDDADKDIHTYYTPFPRGTVLFTDEMGKQVIDFVCQHKLGEEVHRCIVHCDAGRSRSRGLAAALALIFDGDDRDIIKGYTPNMLVYRKVLDSFDWETLNAQI